MFDFTVPYYFIFLESHMNLVASRLLMSTSSSRSLALTCLYSWYSSASGERSSFWTVLLKHKERNKNETRFQEMELKNKPVSCSASFSLLLPPVLSEELVLELLQVLADSFLLLSRLLKLLYKFLPETKRERAGNG